DRVWYSFGASWKALDHVKLDASFAYVGYDDARLRRQDTFFAGTPGAITNSLDARLTGDAWIVGLGLSVVAGKKRGAEKPTQLQQVILLARLRMSGRRS